MTMVETKEYNPMSMTPDGWITLTIIGGAALLLISGRLRPDLIAIMVVLALSLTGVVTPEEALSGFSRSAVITILSLFILTHGLERTGVTRWAGHQLLRMAGTSERRLIIVLMLTSASLAAFMNTIAATAVLLPTAMSIARQTQIRPSRLLIPLASGALLGGTTTLLTTANIIVSSTLSQEGLQPYSLFEFLPVGLPLVIGGTLLMSWLAPRALPARDVAGEIARMQRLRSELAEIYHLREGTCEVVVERGSPMADQTLSQGRWGQELGVTVLGISHEGRMQKAPDGDTEVQEGDILLLEGMPTPEQMNSHGLALTFEGDLISNLASEEVPLVEVTLAPRSELEGRTLREIRFRERYGFLVIALWRQGLVLQQDVAGIKLQFGDAMLLQGPRTKVELLQMDPNFLILEEETGDIFSPRALLAAGIMIVSLILAATNVLPISIATLAGAAAMLVVGCLTMDEAYRSVEWKAIFLIAGMLPLSIALERTGTAAQLAESLFQLTGGLTPVVTAGILLLIAIALSLLLSGQTAAVIVAPIAIAAATPIGVDPRALAMAVAIGCSLAFISPLGHPANLLVMGPGGYTFRDYLRLGTPLTLLSIVIALVALQWMWGL
jgi:di/tricarboxylate transporter